MEINSKLRKGKKFVSSLVNVVLVLSILAVLSPLLMPTTEAATQVIWGDWNVVGTESYKDDIFILYGNLTIGDSDTLEFDNCTLEMAYASNVTGNSIHVEINGEFNLLNNSLITTNSTSPDPYEFRIDGTALINNSIVEKMKDRTGEEDGIQILSPSVTITNSSVRFSSGNGLYIYNAQPTIRNSNISDNSRHGVYMYLADNCIFENNIVNSNNWFGIHLSSSSNNTLINNTCNSNQDGIRLSSSSSNTIVNNTFSLNHDYGIALLYYSSSDNLLDNNNCSNNLDGIRTYLSPTNTISNNMCDSNTGFGIHLASSSSNTIYNNVCSSNNFIGMSIYSSNSNIIENNICNSNKYVGIRLYSSVENKIGMNDISFNTDGINLTSSSERNLITSNDLFNNTNYGLYTASSNNNEIIDNTIQNSSYGVHLISANNNIIYHNNLNNTQNAYDTGTNYWDNGLEGNWWGDMGDYTDSDGDGICDSNYTGTNFVDNLPLANEDNDRVLVDDPWFWFIQSGVNFAEQGWTVYATSSTYLENVTIDKTLTVIGEDRNTTIINARSNEHVVHVESASYVNVSGFTIMNGTNGFYLNNSDYCIIDDNIISSNTYGVNLSKSSDNTIGNNSILDNEYGVHLIESNNTQIRNNEILYSTTAGYYTSLSYDIIMEYNTIINNHVGGRLYNSSFLIQYNNISSNDYGIADVEYSFGNICNNTISYNFDSGITHAVYSNVTINNNTISYNYYGISCMYDSYATITYNNITFNTIGIENTYGSNETIHWNNIHNNTLWNITNLDNTILINATDNYWGTDDPIEIANGINGRVIFDPYKSDPIEEAGPQD